MKKILVYSASVFVGFVLGLNLFFSVGGTVYLPIETKLFDTVLASQDGYFEFTFVSENTVYEYVKGEK